MRPLFRGASWLDAPDNYGYGTWPIPAGLDARINSLIDEWCKLPKEQRGTESLSITEQQSDVLLAFSERMASKAVRDRDRAAIRLGLIAAGLDGWRYEWRENTMMLSLHNHSAVMIGVNAQAVFAGAAVYLVPRVKRAFWRFLERSTQDRSIASMGFRESRDDAGFRYQRT